MVVKEIQLGKNGITDNFISTLEDHLKKLKNIKITVLKSCCRDRDELKEIKNQILEKLKGKYSAKTIGYKIILKKQNK